MAIAAMVVMVLSSILPFISIVGAVSQTYNKTYSSHTDVSIPDAGGAGNPASSSITVAEDVTLTRIDVMATLPKDPAAAQGRARDTIVYLMAPSGVIQVIYNNPGAPGFPASQTINIDQNDLANFVGDAAKGVWTLYAYDKNLVIDNRYNMIDYFEITIYWDFHVDMITPASGSSISGTAYTFQVDSNGKSVDLWVDGTNVSTMTFNGGTGYWEYTMDTTVYKDGIHNIQIKGYSNEGNLLMIQTGVEVDNYQISASIQWPTDGSTVSGAFTVWMSAPDYATRASLSVDGIIISTVNTAPSFGWYQLNLNSANFQDGPHSIIGTTYDPDNNFATSTVSYIFDNYAITCDIASPTTGPISGTYTVTADVPATAVKGELYVDGVLNSIDTTRDGLGQYSFSLVTTNYKDGPHTLEVKAYNTWGTTASDAINLQFDNYAISVSIAWPTTGMQVSGNSNVWAQTQSYASAGRLYVDNNLYQAINSGPNLAGIWYQFSWNTVSSGDGTHSIRVEVDDPDGKTATDTEVPTVNNYGAMSVTITSPIDGSTVSGNPVNVVAQTNSYALKGELYLDDLFVAKDTSLDPSNNYQFSFDSTSYKDGDHKISVRAYDPDGDFVLATVTVTIDNWDISVSISSPTDGGTVSGDITITADVPSYARYGDLYIDGTFVQRDNTVSGANQFDFPWSTTDYPDGVHTIMVMAYDPDGNAATNTVQVTVNNYDITVTFQWPTTGTTISGTTYPVWISTNDYATKVELYMDSDLVGSSSVPAFAGWYNFDLDTTAYREGSHTLSARSYDPDNNFASQVISVIVDNYQISVDITQPIDGAGISGTMNVRATVPTYAVLGECYLDDQLVSTDTTVSSNRFDFAVDSTKFKDGVHVIKVIAYDPEGSSAKHVHMLTFNNWDISVNIFNPAEGGTTSGTITVQATVPTYAKMGEFYIDDVLFGIDTTVTSNRFDMSLNTRQYKDGAHILKVRAYDPDGISAVDTNSVIFNNYDITVNIFSPADGTSISGTVTFMATVPSYAVSGEFYLDDQLIGVDTTITANRFDISVNTRLYKDGPHVIKCKAFDPDGNFAVDTNTNTFSNYNLGVSITSPLANTKISATITVNAQVTESADQARLYLDNSLVSQIYSSRSANGVYSFSVDSRGFTDGNHILRVEVYYTISGESAYDSKAVQFDNTPPSLSGLDVIYLNGLTAVRASGDKVVINAVVSDATSGINTVTLDATNIGGASSVTMFDDGSHNDEESGDGVYGTDPIDVIGTMGFKRVFVKATDKVGNSVTQSTSVACDDHLPIITDTYVVYPGAQTAAKTGDDVRVIAKIVDTTVFVDVVLVLDNSNSITSNFDTVQEDAKDFVDSLSQNDRAAVYDFNGENGANSLSPKREIDFTTDKNAVKNTIDNIVADDGTPLYDTVYAAIQYAKTSNNMPVVVVLTDGNDCGWWGCYSDHPIGDVKFASMPIFTIGLDPGQGYDPINETALKDIAETSNGGAYYHSPSVSQLQQIYQAIAGKIKAFEVGGISSAYVNLLNIGAGSSIPLYDDGSHGDLGVKDNVFGTDMILITSPATDEFNYTVIANDVGGNSVTLLGYIQIDNTPPTVTSVTPIFQGMNWWASDGDTVQFTATVDDPGDVGGILGVRMDASSIGGGKSVPMRDDGTNGDVTADDGVYTSDPVQVSTGLATGIKEVLIYATDIAANQGSGAGSIYVDNHRPILIELVNPASGEYIEGTFTFQVRTNDVEGIDQAQVKIDTAWHGMAYNALSSYFEYLMDTTLITDGTYKASVIMTDLIGRENNGPTDQLFYIDNTPPNLVLVSPVDGAVVNGMVKVDTTGTTDIFLAAIEYKVDDLAWAPVATLWNTSKLVDGSHTLAVKATDNIGHETIRTIKVTVDNGNPEAYFVTPLTGDVLQGKSTVQIKATDNVMISSVFLSGAVISAMEYNSGTGYYEYEFDTTLKADGTYTLGGTVKDLGGHILTMAEVVFSIDNNDPTIKVIKPANNAYLKGNTTVQLNITDGPFPLAKIEWKVDEGAWKSLSSQTFYWNTTTYVDGKHTLWIRATDRGDHVVSTTVPVTVDNNAPTIEMPSPVNNQMIDGIFVFKMHAYDTVGIDKVVLNIEGVNNYTIINNVGASYFEQVIDTTTIKDGTYNVQVTAYDYAGYTTKTSKIKVKIDNHAPLLTVTAPVDGEYLTGDNYTVSGVAQDLFMASVEYSVDSFGTRPINQTLDTTLLSDGEHVIEVLAKDVIGHVTTIKVKVYVDNEKPSVSPVAPQQLEPVSGKYTFRVRAEDINGIDTVRLVYGNISLNMFQNSITGYFEVTRDTTFDQDGSRTFIFNVFDRSGKEVNLTIPSRIDNTAPNVTVLGPDSEAKGVIKFRVKVEDASGLDSVLIRIGGGDWREMRYDNGEYLYRWRSVYSDNGPQPYDIKVVDKLGNEEIYTYDLDVKNPSGKKNLDWLWWVLFIILIVCMVAVALTSRSSRATSYSSSPRSRPQAYGSRMASEDEGDGTPVALHGRRANLDGTQPLGGTSRELGTPAHRVAMRKLEEDIVVSKPQDDEVSFVADEEDISSISQGPMMVGALKSTDSIDTTSEDDVEFMADETDLAASGDDVSFSEEGSEDVSFTPDAMDDVSFSEDGSDEVSFDDDGDDEVSFSDDSSDDVQFTDDSGGFGGSSAQEDVEFLDDSAPPATPIAPFVTKVPERRVPVALTPRTVKATPVAAKKPTPTVSRGAIKGIDDLLSDSGPKPTPKAKPAPQKAKPTKSDNDNPLGDLIGDI